MGAPTGLRQISISRYSFGWWPTKLVAVLNTIQQVGWSSAGCITGGIALNAVADGKVSTTVGIVIIAVCSLIVSFFGIKAILPFERYAWLVYLVVFLIILGQTGSSADATPGTSLEGLELSGTVLSLLAIVYGSSASWCSCASDYYVLYPPSTSRTKVFLLTTLGVSMPTAFCMICGCVVSSALNNQPDWLDAYNNNGGSGLGFLLQTALHPSGFAKFLLVLLVLSGINCNIINTYSAALSCQQFARPFARIPRVLWTLACFAVILAIALAGRDQGVHGLLDRAGGGAHHHDHPVGVRRPVVVDQPVPALGALGLLGRAIGAAGRGAAIGARAERHVPLADGGRRRRRGAGRRAARRARPVVVRVGHPDVAVAVDVNAEPTFPIRAPELHWPAVLSRNARIWAGADP